MKELIEALQILLKYGDVKYPVHCEHDTLHIVGYEPEKISKEDRYRLNELGIIVRVAGEINEDEGEIRESEIFSYKYGSA